MKDKSAAPGSKSDDNPAMTAFIDALMSKMTLQEKLGQLNLVTSNIPVEQDRAADIRAGRAGAGPARGEVDQKRRGRGECEPAQRPLARGGGHDQVEGGERRRQLHPGDATIVEPHRPEHPGREAGEQQKGTNHDRCPDQR